MKVVHKECPNKVLVLKIDETDINTIFMNVDINDAGEMQYLYDKFAEEISNIVPEYVAGFNDTVYTQANAVKRLRELAKAIMSLPYMSELYVYFNNRTPIEHWEEKIRNYYNRKGVFGEIVLHYILKHFKNTIPLISKIYVKDSVSQEAHGYDAVHITSEDNNSVLWLGESKFYTDGKEGLKSLIEDLNKHFKCDFLNEQFAIISRQLQGGNHPQRDLWLQILSETSLLKDKFQLIKIPLFCIYEHTIANDFLHNIAELSDNIVTHSVDYQKYFVDNNNLSNKDKVQIILILMPVKCKNDLTYHLLQKIYHLQGI